MLRQPRRQSSLPRAEAWTENTTAVGQAPSLMTIGAVVAPLTGEGPLTMEADPPTWARQEIHMHLTTGLCIPLATVLVRIPAPAATLLNRITVPLSSSLRHLASTAQLHLLRLTELTVPMAGTEAE